MQATITKCCKMLHDLASAKLLTQRQWHWNVKNILQGRVFFYGIRQIKIFVRELTGAYHSDVYFSAPNWNKQYKRRVVVSMNGEDGKDGINGPQSK